VVVVASIERAKERERERERERETDAARIMRGDGDDAGVDGLERAVRSIRVRPSAPRDDDDDDDDDETTRRRANRTAEAMAGARAGATRRTTVAECVAMCATPRLATMAYRTLRDCGKKMDEATLRDVTRLCDGVVEWACARGRAATMEEVMGELESRARDLEATLAAGWRGTDFEVGSGETSVSSPVSPSSPVDDALTNDAFHKVTELRARSGQRARVVEAWIDATSAKLSAEENWFCVIKPKMLLRAYEVLVDRRDVNDASVEELVDARFEKWVEEWRRRAQMHKRETGETPDHEYFKRYLHDFLSSKLPAFATGVNKMSFKRRYDSKTRTEAIYGEDFSPKNIETMDEAVRALRCAENSREVRALLTAKWLRKLLVHAPPFTLPAARSAKNADNGGQMMKDWQREEGFLLRFTDAPEASTSGVTAGFKNVPEDQWNTSYISTGPFRVHFMRACAEIESALQKCGTCNVNNVTADEKKEACVKGAARIMFVASRTIRSGDGLDFTHNLFGQPPEYTVSLVDPGKTKKLLAEHTEHRAPIVINVSRTHVEICSVDVFTVTKHHFEKDTDHSDFFLHWASVALTTTQTLRIVEDGSLKLCKQRIAVDEDIPQTVVSAFLDDLTAAERDNIDRDRSKSTTDSPRASRQVRVSADAFA